ncbi:hypothetical protein FISHEDRAFT_8825, partial [Fistulina hepatica ATCC 64428]
LRRSDLHGLEVPGCEERIILLLFADDTTVYLADADKMSDLQKILDEWCEASRAKFNVKKMEIILIGEKEYRVRMAQTRHRDTASEVIPQETHIAVDGEAVRILGAWFGNNIDDGAPWLPVLGKVTKAFERWEKSKPTIGGRRLIVQMVAGGITQYLAEVQGMPEAVEKKLTKRIRQFMWAEKTMSPVNSETLFAPLESG